MDAVDSGLPAYVAWLAGTTSLCRSQLYPPKGYEFGYWIPIPIPLKGITDALIFDSLDRDKGKIRDETLTVSSSHKHSLKHFYSHGNS
jgi:hypothetical protein